MENSVSLVFPFKHDTENDCMKRATTAEEAVVSWMKCFLITRKGSRVGNNIGSFLPELLLQGIPVSRLSELSGQLKKELTEQFPGVDVLNVDMKQDLSEDEATLKVHIQLSIPTVTGIVDLDLNLPSIFSK